MNRLFADLSNNNPQPVDWHRYHRAGHVLVGLKATEGTGFIDSTHAGRSEGAHAAGVHVLHYHFAHAGQDAHAQAEAFWRQIHGHFARHDFACLDIEEGGQDGKSLTEVARFVRDFDTRFRSLSGHSLLGYSNQAFLAELARAGGRVAGDRWWIAAYGPNAPTVAGVTRWGWQYTDGTQGPEPHHYAGIGACDGSLLNWGTYLRLRVLRP